MTLNNALSKQHFTVKFSSICQQWHRVSKHFVCSQANFNRRNERLLSLIITVDPVR